MMSWGAASDPASRRGRTPHKIPRCPKTRDRIPGRRTLRMLKSNEPAWKDFIDNMQEYHPICLREFNCRVTLNLTACPSATVSRRSRQPRTCNDAWPSTIAACRWPMICSMQRRQCGASLPPPGLRSTRRTVRGNASGDWRGLAALLTLPPSLSCRSSLGCYDGMQRARLGGVAARFFPVR